MALLQLLQLAAAFTPRGALRRALFTQSLRNDDIVIRPQRTDRQETLEQRRSRLLFQSRKRGIKENDLIFSTFSGKYLSTMSEAELKEYDSILNDHDNEWDMFYCLTKKKPIPDYLSQYTLLPKLMEHVANARKEVRIDSPALH